ncbi:MAG: type II toxin-antitoxin system VapC family toxin [Candidatus Lustribacter sp.]
MSAAQPGVVYWDTSAIISALFHDRHSDAASAAARAPGTHLMSSLGWAEVQAVIARIEREQALSPVLVSAAREAVERGPWVRLSVDPDRQQIAALARAWPLRGADLWHLAAAKALQADLPELRLLSFDTRLAEAARGEGFR